jgi:hypothetical protein
MPQSQYEIPIYGSNAQRVHGWCLEAEQEGQGWLNAQQPAGEWNAALQMLSANGVGGAAAGTTSNLGYNKGKRIARELVAGLTDFRHEGEYKVTWNNKLYDQAHTLTNLDDNWYRTCNPYAAHRQAVQYAVATGTAYLWQTWDRNYHSAYRGDIALTALSPQDVMFIQLPRDHNIQKAYAVIVREELPINLARAVYSDLQGGAFSATLQPDRDVPGLIQRGLQRVQKFLSPALRVAGKMGQNQQASYPTVDIFHMWTIDGTHNEGPIAIDMGARGTNWAYKVPALGDPMPTGMINPATGEPFTLAATREHTRMFPLRRYTIFSRTALGYDGSSPYWHGKAPLARLRFGDWAWEALGQSSLADLKTMQDGIVALMRGVEDNSAATLDPFMLYDDTLVSRTWAESVNPRMAGGRAAAPLMQGDPIRPAVPKEYLMVPPFIPDWIQQQEARMDYLSGVTDLVAISKARQIPGADTLEKLMEMAGPIVRDNVRALEGPLQELGEMRKSLYFQFYTKQRMLSVTGPDGVVIDKYYGPEMLMPWQSMQEQDGKMVPTESAAERQQRFAAMTTEQRNTVTRGYLDDFRYHVTESGINEINRMSQKLLFLQLQKAGFPISPWTLAKICQIPNFGPPPMGTNTEMERWIAWQRMQIDLELDKAQQIQEGAMERGLGGPGDAAAGGGEGGEGGPAGPAAGGGQGGRPPSFTGPPKMVSKDGGSRTTVTTSK